jgi:hypothetical protein
MNPAGQVKLRQPVISIIDGMKTLIENTFKGLLTLIVGWASGATLLLGLVVLTQSALA